MTLHQRNKTPETVEIVGRLCETPRRLAPVTDAKQRPGFPTPCNDRFNQSLQDRALLICHSILTIRNLTRNLPDVSNAHYDCDYRSERESDEGRCSRQKRAADFAN